MSKKKKKKGFLSQILKRSGPAGNKAGESDNEEAAEPVEDGAPLIEEDAEAEVVAEPGDVPAEPGDVPAEPGDVSEEAALDEAREAAEEDETEPPAEEPEIAAAEPETETPRKVGLIARFKSRLSKTKDGMIERIRQVASLTGKVDEETLEEIEMILIQADVGIETTQKIIDRMRRSSAARRADSAEGVVTAFKEALVEILGHQHGGLHLREDGPTVVLVAGVNGVGKTTTIGKIAAEFHAAGKKTMMVAADTFRAAAVEQLEIWADRTGSTLVRQEMGADPGAVCYDALSSSEINGYDLVLVDTAGRLQTKSHLMDELGKIRRVADKVMPGAPHETLLVLDATTGQNALSQAKLFSEVVNVTGFVMTKLDGTAKGGILVALKDLFDIPIVKVGIGESAEDLRDFDADAFVEAMFAR